MNELEIVKVSESFWRIIHSANKDRAALKTILEDISKKELYDFQKDFYILSVELQDEPFIDYMEESEDGIEDISFWIVSQGKKYYIEIWNKPELVPYSVEEKSDGILFDIGLDLYFNRFNEDMDIWD